MSKSDDKSENNPKSEKRKSISEPIKREVLTEAGYICANPGCRTLMFELHHITYVAEGGKDTADNLIALCPNCHTRVHTKEIHADSVRAWKVMVVAVNRAWTKETATALLFLDSPVGSDLVLTGDGVVRFADLIVSGLAEVMPRDDFVGEGVAPIFLETNFKMQFPASELAKRAYSVRLTEKGTLLAEAWKSGSVERITSALDLLEKKDSAE
ncbi:HNH endonuclease signature motif containing protein [Paraburkholderia sp. BCC1876]|uniref:HNH endonuclease signature motif containing protein n=1 Tax=Paraburkholderia sp. BCC1876 TaxID=2676303 RepID=UPI001ABA363B|nr:HNH endonuclease signature motif containing protein [Paraburkholderia sp. BCC1876]